MKRIILAILGVGFIALPLYLYATSVGKANGVSETSVGKVMGLGWYTGTQTLGTVNGMTADASSQSHTYNSSNADGYVGKYSMTSWDDAHDGATGNEVLKDDSYTSQAGAYKVGLYWGCRRVFFYFDTSSIPDNATITDVKLHMYGYSAGTNQVVCALKGTQADTLANEEYDSYTGSPYGTCTWAVNAWNVITFNAQGRADINLTGVTKICVMEYTHDFLDSGSTVSNMFGLYFNEDANHKPYLEVYY